MSLSKIHVEQKKVRKHNNGFIVEFSDVSYDNLLGTFAYLTPPNGGVSITSERWVFDIIFKTKIIYS